MYFLPVNVTFYEAVNMIRDIIRTATCLSALEIINLNK